MPALRTLTAASTLLALSMGLTACGGNKPAEEAKATNETAEASAEVVRFATEGAYPPMNFTDKDGNLGGFDVDVANALCEQMKANCEIVAQDWEGIIPGLQAEKYDAVIAGMSITDERKQVVDFTDPYFSSGLLLIAKKGEEASFESLAGKSVGAQTATIASQYLEEEYPDIDVKLYDTQENVNLDLINGRLDAVLVDQVVGTDWLSSEDAANFEQKGEAVSTGKDDFGIATRKDDELTGKLNTALADIKSNGKYDEISSKYFSK